MRPWKTASGALERFALSGAAVERPAGPARFDRIAYSAAHVVSDPRAAIDPWLQCAVDWDATIAYRQRLWSLGLGVAEAMDTAQRGMGLDWPTSLELIRRSLEAARTFGPGALVASGCGTDHLDPATVASVDQVIRAYEEQMEAIEALGGRLIVMASRALARVARETRTLRISLESPLRTLREFMQTDPTRTEDDLEAVDAALMEATREVGEWLAMIDALPAHERGDMEAMGASAGPIRSAARRIAACGMPSLPVSSSATSRL